MKIKRKLSDIESKKAYAMLMVLFPSILLVLVSLGIDNFLSRSIAQILLFVLQLFIVRVIIDRAYNQY
jgi:hypothetical protein